MNTINPNAWFQISRAYRTVARLPEGKTGIQALIDATKDRREDAERWANGLGEASAGDHYLRVHSPKKDQLELTFHEFAAFRRMGGGTYQGK
jgi:hypothetical protein